MRRVCYILPLLLILAGCAPLQDTARDAIAASKGVLESAQLQHRDSCIADPHQKTCVIIHDGVAAENSAIDALELYCSNSGAQSFQTGGPCIVDKSAAPKLEAALANLNQIISDVKGLVKP